MEDTIDNIEDESENIQNEETSQWKNKEWIIAIIVICTLLFVLSAGGLAKLFGIKTDLEAKRNNSVSKRKEYSELLREKRGKKKQLDKLFRIAFFIVRGLLLLVFYGVNFLFYFIWNFSIDEITNFNELFLIGYASITFAIHGSPKGLTKTFEDMKNGIKKLVYRKHPNIESEITEFKRLRKIEKKKSKKLSKKIKKIDKKIEEEKENIFDSLPQEGED